MSTLPVSPPDALPQAWLDDLAAARADRLGGRIYEIDLDALCGEIDAEATEIEARHGERAALSRK